MKLDHRPCKRKLLPGGWHTWAAALLLSAGGCSFPGQPDPADRPVPPSQIVEFEPLYERHCAGCHGADGELGPAPPLNDPLFLAIVPDDVLLQMVNEGRPAALMPAFARQHGGRLTAAQVKALATGIKPQWGSRDVLDVETVPPYLLTGDDAGFSDPMAVDRGRALFATACAGCHGEYGKSGEGALAGPVNDARLLELFSDQVLRRLIITGRPDLGMPTFAQGDGRPDDFQPLTSDQISDLVALLRHFRRGDAEEPPALAATASGPPAANEASERQAAGKP